MKKRAKPLGAGNLGRFQNPARQREQEQISEPQQHQKHHGDIRAAQLCGSQEVEKGKSVLLVDTLAPIPNSGRPKLAPKKESQERRFMFERVDVVADGKQVIVDQDQPGTRRNTKGRRAGPPSKGNAQAPRPNVALPQHVAKSGWGMH